MMRNALLLLALLLATPLCLASMNVLPASELPRAMLARTCNVLNLPQADWGDINAVVRSARACLSQKAGQGPNPRPRLLAPAAEPQAVDEKVLWQGISVARSSR
ncbi:hypothetical protein HZI31_10270 [Serratia fonticola]|uniref:hypothetical protein n=1 Tax=Serratia fonticola TaxID=47917 RepID=UPI0015C66E4D|nr:hypothetical protein [Serratia fonticola]NYA43683.1 hypothetical protein [Serratia fonticola]